MTQKTCLAGAFFAPYAFRPPWEDGPELYPGYPRPNSCTLRYLPPRWPKPYGTTPIQCNNPVGTIPFKWPIVPKDLPTYQYSSEIPCSSTAQCPLSSLCTPSTNGQYGQVSSSPSICKPILSTGQL